MYISRYKHHKFTSSPKLYRINNYDYPFSAPRANCLKFCKTAVLVVCQQDNHVNDRCACAKI
ncbi:MAG: hypothetical protein E7493_10645 [Ruminococcus albus]|uniref:Conserved domain protein n=1 Tax=Ruminococcus albus 8 TaxID=246199 RepID=E9SC30_RUMAL|nr:conserved domain protein [Ruminococcus albus 8]MBE6874349.1 hypothetical protein [Ruminococcus albus]